MQRRHIEWSGVVITGNSPGATKRIQMPALSALRHLRSGRQATILTFSTVRFLAGARGKISFTDAARHPGKSGRQARKSNSGAVPRRGATSDKVCYVNLQGPSENRNLPPTPRPLSRQRPAPAKETPFPGLMSETRRLKTTALASQPRRRVPPLTLSQPLRYPAREGSNAPRLSM